MLTDDCDDSSALIFSINDRSLVRRGDSKIDGADDYDADGDGLDDRMTSRIHLNL